ncbi:SEC-C metal-binding domain-containing protein [Cohnella sp. 56]|uniref:SEC-C metal-binding domain-containing protein n=1 Tax=Cohnella sp. 56 TaxID=3113722 RepID=UPI0030E977E4
MSKPGRNDPCHCGSGKKYKKCCLEIDESQKVVPLKTAFAESSPEERIERELTWSTEAVKMVARHFANRTNGLYKPKEVNTVLAMWSDYANVNDPLIKKAGVFTAALEYVLCQTYGYETTQTELALKYNVSAGSISQRVGRLHAFLADDSPARSNKAGQSSSTVPNSRMVMEKEMQHVFDLLANQDFSSTEEANAFIQQHLQQRTGQAGRRKQSPEERARELVYEAWEQQDPERRGKLAQDALLLDPDCVDAYNVLAETIASSPKEMAYYYQKGMLAGERAFGEPFFEEYKGHFWGYLPTRPYMRAKKGYAEACAEMHNMTEAIKHYEEMLTLNPNDNQGVRELLALAYLEVENWENAHELLERYEDGSAAANYNRILVAFGLDRRSPELPQLVKTAIAQNHHVVPYLLEKKRLPREMPDYYGFGDESEAKIYAMTHAHLWKVRPELLQLLEKSR